ncbi:MAG: diphosphomevalonate decarboxylase, partial [Bdellovibrionales bacterium]|nr:diphosphomevalonate decarboxylase [Bdellovibrionales bacterium]
AVPLKWTASAPSNLALIKYMGKKPAKAGQNIPLNSSLSFTLNHFITKVEIEEASSDSWSSFEKGSVFYTELSIQAQKRFLDFFQSLKKYFSIPGYYKICSGNNFPLSTGAASSASSFAALTQAVYKLAQEQTDLQKKLSVEELSQISRSGSGSSCRSFFSPWALWTEKRVQPLKFPFENFIHQMIVTSDSDKKIFSRDAHKRVESSPYFKERPQRAETRLKELCSALRSQDWYRCYLLVREEFLDMHHLFETAHPPFSYQTKSSGQVLEKVENFWKQRGDGPLVTMDAGSSVHLLYRLDQKELAEEFSSLLPVKKILSNQ